MLILISDSFNQSLPEKLKKFGEVTNDKNRLSEAEIVLIRSKTKATKEYIDSAPNLKLILRGGVGLDNVDIQYAVSKGIQVKNTAEASTTAVAELAFSMMMGLANQVNFADNSMREGKWLKKEIHRVELYGKTLGILGMGRIGTSLAIRARAFQMRVLAWHPDVHFSDFAEIRPTLDEVIKESDFISVHIPLLDETAGMINKEKLSLCKKGAFIINTGRAQVVNENDVAEFLKSGHLGGYATDVWQKDPPDGSPLFEAPNCLFSPHVGASTQENMTRIGIVMEMLIDLYIEEKNKG